MTDALSAKRIDLFLTLSGYVFPGQRSLNARYSCVCVLPP